MTARETEAVSKLVASIVTQGERKSKGAFAGLGYAHSLPFRVGQHIVCIDSGLSPAANTNSWSGRCPEPRSAKGALII